MLTRDKPRYAKNVESAGSRDYPHMKQGDEKTLDPHQKWVQDIYRDLVDYVVREHPGLNINQITDVVIAERENWFKRIKQSPPDENRRLPLGAPTRKTVSRHLKMLEAKSRVVEIGGQYLSAFDYVAKHSKALSGQVKRLLKNKSFDTWSFLPAGRVAGLFTFTSPTPYHSGVADLKMLQQERFADSLFWIDDILRDAILTKKMSPKVYSNGLINMNLLKAGWEGFFGDTNLIIFAFAINLPEFLQFLTETRGRALLSSRLENNWERLRMDIETDVDRLKLSRVEWS